MINVANVSKSYESLKALENINFNIKEREIVGILGPNGAGKSTLIKILTAYHFPSQGSVKIFNKDITSDSKLILKNVGYVPERVSLYPELTVREYLSFIAKAKGVLNLEKEISKVLSFFKLESVEFKVVSKLSKGYRQRVGLAQGFLNEPKILILDEATNGLDPNQIIEFKELLREKSKKTTILFSSHILSEVESICSRIIIINKGKIIRDDLKDNILREREKGQLEVRFIKLEKMDLDSLKENSIFIPLKREEKKREIKMTIALKDGQDEEKLFDYIVAKKLKIRELSRKSESNLEEIFKTLTKESN